MLKIENSLLVLLIISTLLGITYPIRLEHPLLFIIAEVVSVISTLWIIRLYFFVSRPLKELGNAINLLSNNDFQSRLLPTPHPVVNKLVVVFNKMINQLHKERVEQREQSYFLEHLLKATPHGIVVLDYDQKVIQTNPTILHILELKFNALKNKRFIDIEHPLISEINQLALNQVKDIQLSGGRRYRCQKSSFIFQGFQQQFIIVQDLYLDDIKKEKQAYSKVIRMMSHEVNNSVGAMNSYLDTLKLFSPADEELKTDYLEALSIVKDRNSAMAEFMKNFASVVKIPEPNLENVNLIKILQDLLEIYHSDFKNNHIQVLDKFPKELAVIADKSLLEQLFINIFKNAKEALLEVDQTDRTLEISFNEETKKLVIWNSGPKISKETEEKLFTPFYSSKPTGQGIGLMICRDILLKHKWDFRLFSGKKEGVTFEISF
ncbi:sensor histidine kinase [Flammeovirga kamogawensis]|uniref:histidine kinase n=1 Tax=Flammeovirga kamogawensis TaxID=373891 RepID=A0ABX8H3R0_9BACT|nr:ATP-binding protein [Flammeovirga kamogawensis]MBB6460488.1 signal transduction histidine kinase [Flammeovirga kamogawensis]QWG10294.1 GHKL domain-containing protein [Flammeovirga kamogawensis]TRX64742.1 GHKL domain-containing protein [Flammeovirga kamogawensis]